MGWTFTEVRQAAQAARLQQTSPSTAHCFVEPSLLDHPFSFRHYAA
jgi:hypothetical protein